MELSITQHIELEKQSKEMRAILRRAEQRRLTRSDQNKLSNCPPHCRNDLEAARALYDASKKRIRESTRNLLDSGRILDFPIECAIAPSIMLRGGLFRPLPRHARSWVNKEIIASWSDTELTYTGVTLSQSDLDVLMCITQLLRDAQKLNLSQRIETESGLTVYQRLSFSEYDLITRLNRSSSNTTYRWLFSAICRLKGQISYSHPKEKLSFPILGESARIQSGESYLDINENFIRLLGMDNFSLINMEERLALKSDTAKWLHGFIASHKTGSMISAEKLMLFSKSSAKRPRDFIRKRLIPALEELVRVSAIKEFKQRGHLFHWIR